MADRRCIHTRGVRKMDIMINDTEVEHTVWVADIDRDIEGILGFHFLQRHQCGIYAGTNRLKLNCQPVKCATVEVKRIRCCRAVVDKASIMAPGVEIIIPGRVLDLEAASSCAILVPTKKFTEESIIVDETTENTVATQVSQGQKNWDDILLLAFMAYRSAAYDYEILTKMK
ncbi:hypothetical protein CHS0354_018097 [Potamilus streckersoni]|uniref:Uncharacterized protein n=1 Tax=Potamilus streckersoni TaxID=2493646 RepID=A0AAE0WFW0_9BIVA|nr:hypothetical protein CHS0354_018097 [Potamilus streckersoni]